MDPNPSQAWIWEPGRQLAESENRPASENCPDSGNQFSSSMDLDLSPPQRWVADNAGQYATSTSIGMLQTMYPTDGQASHQEDHAIHQPLQQEEYKDLQPRDQYSSQVEQTEHQQSDKHQHQQMSGQSEHEKMIIQQENPSTDQHQLQSDQVVEKSLSSISQENYVHESEQDKLQNSESPQKILTQQSNDQQASTSEQAENMMRRTKSGSGSIPFNILIPILRPHLDKDRNMQLENVFFRLRRNEISKENFLRVIRNIVGDQMLRQAAQKVQTQITARNSQISSSQHQPQASQQQASHGPQQFIEGQSITRPHSVSSMQSQRRQSLPRVPLFDEVPLTPIQKGQRSPPDQSQVTVSAAQIQIDASTVKSNDLDNQSESKGHLPVQASSTNMNIVKQERDISVVSNQAVDNQQQHSQHPTLSLPPYGDKMTNFNSHMFPRPPGIASVTSRKSQTQGSHLRQLTPQGILSTQSGASQPVDVTDASKNEVQNIVTETSRHGGPVSHFTSHLSSQQSHVTWQSSAIKEQKSSTLATTSFIKPEETVEQQIRPQFSALQGSFGTMHIDRGSQSSSSSKDEIVEKQASKISFPASTNMVMTNQMPGSVTSHVESGTQIRTPIPSAVPPVGASTRTPQKKPSVGQKKPLEAQGTPPSASKKQKVSGAYHDQSIEQLNDVTAVSGVNLREEEEQLLSAPKEESRASEATRKVVQEEEERLILQKGPLQKRLLEIMSKCGVKNIGTDVERCLSLCVEERLRGLISNLIRVSRQRVDIEKARHRIVFTSDVRRHILMINKKAKEDWEKKQAEEAEKFRKQNESEGNAGGDAEKEKDEGGRSKTLKATKEEDDKMRTTAANVAARAAVGGDDMLSKWQLMAEQARQKREGGLDTVFGALPGRATGCKPSSDFGKSSREIQEAEKKGYSVAASAAGSMRKFGRIIPQPKVVRSISTKDVVSILEREPQMTKSSLIYRLYDRTLGNSPTE